MLSNHTLRPEKIHSKATTATNHVSASLTTAATIAASKPDLPAVPFARFPHALAADKRLSPTERLIGSALLFWARDRTMATMSNRSLANYVGVSLSVIERGLRALGRLGYIVCESVRATASNATGRIVHLAWVESPTVLPAGPDRRDLEGSAEQGTSPATGGPVSQAEEPPSPATGGASSGATDKEDRLVKKAKNPENARTEGELIERQRPQADDQAKPPSPAPGDPPPLAQALDRAMVDARQAASMATEPINAGPGDLLTDGQRQALEVMTKAEREAFERKSPGMRADILRPFERGFEPRIFERMTRAQLTVPRFVADQRPVDRSTPGLVAAVAGGDPRLVIELAESICRDLGGAGDRRRWGAIHSLAKQVLDQAVSADDVLDAFGQAMGPKAENRGAVFTTALKRTGWKPGSKGF